MPNPLTHHLTWDIEDSTKVSGYHDCARKHFFEHRLGWKQESTSTHLIYGIASHIAQEYLLLNGHSQKSVEEAFELFMIEYRKEISPTMDLDLVPKDPATAKRLLEQYAATYRDDEFEVLYTEIAGSVTVGKTLTGEDRSIHFRIDAILKDKNGLMLVMDHKTAGRNSRQWQDQFQLSTQMWVYIHVLYCLYGADKVYGAIINGLIPMKTKIDLVRIPVIKTPDMMNAGMFDINEVLDRIEYDTKRLMENCSEEDQVMQSFARNPGSCTKYFGCQFAPFCTVWANPLKRIHEPPPGFKVEFWDPSKVEPNTKTIMEIAGGQPASITPALE